MSVMADATAAVGNDASDKPHPSEVIVRHATTADVVHIRRLVDVFSPDRRLLSKATVALYEDVQEFVVAEVAGEVVGCGGLHVMWEDLAEVRTLAVDPAVAGRGVGSRIVEELLRRARTVGVKRVFVLSFEVEFFRRYGFVEIEGTPVEHDVFEQLLRSYDEGVAEFLDLERVKPNTLGNTRMLLIL
jgi:amino-acid N-acetyltransferase